VIPTNIVSDLYRNKIDKNVLIKEITQELNILKYVVRSSSSQEDNSNSSMA